MSLAQHVRGWTGGIGVWRKLAVALAAAALNRMLAFGRPSYVRIA